MALNEKIKILRKNTGMTQEQLAEKIGVTRQTVSKWEKGMSVPDADILMNMADAFDVTVSELLGYDAKDIPVNDCPPILALLNEQLAEKNRSRKTIVKIIKIVLIVLGVSYVALILYILFWMMVAAR